jgi:hypothetical protein
MNKKPAKFFRYLKLAYHSLMFHLLFPPLHKEDRDSDLGHQWKKNWEGLSDEQIEENIRKRKRFKFDKYRN